VQRSYLLSPEEALLVKAKEGFDERIGIKSRARKPGDRWFVYGPGEYFPPVQVQVMGRRSALLQIEPLGIYLFYSVFSLVLFIILLLFSTFALHRWMYL
jgi:hypothetical protein